MPSKSLKSGPVKNNQAHLRNIKLVLEYDGSAFHGFQLQPKHTSVQRSLEKALARLCGKKTKISSASGRTDAGVHALHQVVNFKTQSPRPVQVIQKALNAVLPDEIAVVSAEEVPESFHARFDVKVKTYEYRIWNSRVRSPLLIGRVWHVPFKLDLEKMKKGAELLCGTHDFRSFCTTDASKKNQETTRTVYSFEVLQEGNLIFLRVSADGFLYRMVRNFAGALADLGSGKISLEDLKKSLQAKDRREVGCMAPSEGLYLFNVTY